MSEINHLQAWKDEAVKWKDLYEKTMISLQEHKRLIEEYKR
jgi:hypothetical protein